MTELQKRVLSSVVLIPLVLWVIWVGGWLFTGFVILLAVLMLYEWFTITKEGNFLWKILGIFYVGLPCAGLIFIRNLSIEPIIILLIIVWATDTGAYFAGKNFGKRKLAPKISPNKTWAGFFGGILCAVVITCVTSHFYINTIDTITIKSFLFIALFIMVLSVFSQLGDLFESWIKRKFGVKDSGNIIPGHGGILDRVDGLLFALFPFLIVAFMTYVGGEIDGSNYCGDFCDNGSDCTATLEEVDKVK